MNKNKMIPITLLFEFVFDNFEIFIIEEDLLKTDLRRRGYQDSIPWGLQSLRWLYCYRGMLSGVTQEQLQNILYVTYEPQGTSQHVLNNHHITITPNRLYYNNSQLLLFQNTLLSRIIVTEIDKITVYLLWNTGDLKVLTFYETIGEYNTKDIIQIYEKGDIVIIATLTGKIYCLCRTIDYNMFSGKPIIHYNLKEIIPGTREYVIFASNNIDIPPSNTVYF